ncbi:MAG TPA: FHA domain-containing protein [Aggregatilineales bacterium]|nr:FHA domain-containing protein [Anaerolineales bacterium]HRE48859.1 FHA domain-containing protein [Aggregatilineales bacterium]
MLVSGVPAETSTFIRTGKTKDLPAQPPGIATGSLSAPQHPNAVSLYIANTSTPLVLYIPDQVVLGRYTANQNSSMPLADLTPYKAYGYGVSRQHALLKRTGKGLCVEDLASANGTFLNGTRLPPNAPTLIHKGDRLTLGQLEMEIYLSEG